MIHARLPRMTTCGAEFLNPPYAPCHTGAFHPPSDSLPRNQTGAHAESPIDIDRQLTVSKHGSLQSTLFSAQLKFRSIQDNFVQILNFSRHWACVSTLGCNPGDVKVHDSIFFTISFTCSTVLLLVADKGESVDDECHAYAVAK